MIFVGAMLVAALVVGWRRGRRDRTPDRLRGRRRAAVVVATLVAGLALLAVPASAEPFDCKAAPDPDRPGTGLVGSLDPAPRGVGAPGSVYDEVGYAGQVWWIYDTGCGPGAAQAPAATIDTWLGNQMFNMAKLIVGGVNWAHYLIERGSGLLQPLDGIVQAGTQAMYQAVFTTWAGVALLVLTVILLGLAMRGDLSRQAQRAGIALVALVVAAGAYAAPIRWSSALDGVLLDGVTAMQRGFLSQVGVGDANTLPTVLTDQIVYTNWLRGEFGSADVPQAQADGRALLRAQTFTKQEVAEGQDGTEQADRKKGEFAAVADRAGDRYSYLQGLQGSRVGAGMLAFVQAACIGLFQLMSKLLVLVSMLVIRLLIMVAPALAVLALVKPEVLPATLRVGGAALVNTLLVGAMAGLHSLMVIALFRPGSGVDLWLGLLVTGVVTVIFWTLARPFRRLAAMVSMTRDQMGGLLPAAGTGALGRMLGRGGSSDRQDQWWQQRRVTVGGTRGAGWRPENGAPARTAEPATAGASGAGAAGGPVRVDSERVTARADGGDPAAALAARQAARRALPAGVGSAGSALSGGPPRGDRDATPSRVRTDADRSLYRSLAARTGEAGGPPRSPVQAELVDGAPVYRIYRPSTNGRGVVTSTPSPRTPVRGAPVPIRTRRGRAAAYRSLWEWPLHSPVRLFGCLVVLTLVVVGVSSLSGLVGGAGGRSSAALGPVPTAAPAGPVAPVAPTELTPTTLPVADAPPVALAVAQRWTQAWATHGPGITPAQWSAGLAPYTTEEYMGVLASVDPSNVPGTRVTGPPQAVQVRPEAVRVQVPTDAVLLELLLVQTAPGDWRVSGYDRAS